MTSSPASWPLERLRNIGIAAHIDAGKTTLSERILVTTGKERRVGRVDEGTATLDWMEEERERGITITAAATSVFWKDHLIQLIDTPGHVDFTIEVERCMRVLDGGVLVLDAIEAVQAQTDTVWRQMAKRELPVLGFVNKCERAGANFLGVAAKVRQRLGASAYAVQYPIEVEGRLVGIADVLTRTMATVGDAGEVTGQPVPASAQDEVDVLRIELLEVLAETDEGLIEAALGQADLDLERAHRALRQAVLERKFVPLLAGSALQGLGVTALLDAVVRYLPSPLDRPAVRGYEPGESHRVLERPPSLDAPLCALAFKLAGDDHGETTFVRVYSGQVHENGHLYNPRLQKGYRVREIRRMHADHFERIPSAGPGDIVALRGPTGVATGDTLCAKDAPILLESLQVPEPVIARILEPQNSEERDRLRAALQRLTHEDLALRVREKRTTGQFVVEGMGSLHLEIQVARLKKQFGLQPRVGAPQVSYREYLLGRSEGSAEVLPEGPGAERPCRVRLAVAPRPPERGRYGPGRVEWAPGLTPLPELEEVLLAGLKTGPMLGYPLLGAQCRVLEVDFGEAGEGGGGRDPSSAQLPSGVVIAAQKALDQALEACSAGWLEPVVQLEIQVPEEFRGGILADLGARGAEIDHVQSELGHCSIQGLVPLALVFDYSTEIRSLSQGRAHFAMHPSGHRPVSGEVLSDRGLVL